MKIFVIGSNSFSGSNFVDFALNNGFLVFGISRSVPPNNVFLKYSENNIKVQNFKYCHIIIFLTMEMIFLLIQITQMWGVHLYCQSIIFLERTSLYFII